MLVVCTNGVTRGKRNVKMIFDAEPTQSIGSIATLINKGETSNIGNICTQSYQVPWACVADGL